MDERSVGSRTDDSSWHACLTPPCMRFVSIIPASFFFFFFCPGGGEHVLHGLERLLEAPGGEDEHQLPHAPFVSGRLELFPGELSVAPVACTHTHVYHTQFLTHPHW